MAAEAVCWVPIRYPLLVVEPGVWVQGDSESDEGPEEEPLDSQSCLHGFEGIVDWWAD